MRSIFRCLLVISAYLIGATSPAGAGSAVLTHHHDVARTGWNSSETILTAASLASTHKLGVIATVSNLDDTVDAQPLVLPYVSITCPPNQSVVTCQKGLTGGYEVVFVATMSNTVYAINTANGQILLQRNFGAPSTCGGIKATPVIDGATGTLYVITNSVVNSTSTFTLHALNVQTLMDSVAAFTITSSNTTTTLADGTVYGFNSAGSCQTSALLLEGGVVYAGFRGNEIQTSTSPYIASGPTRGWLLGWKAATLAPIAPLATDLEATSTNGFFLTSIWMSGAGVASDGSNLYFVTGNSDPAGKSYDPVKNIEESVVEVTPNLTVKSLFTPSNFAALDAADFDLGSGGALVISSASGPLVVAAGKDGRMFLLDGNNLGGYTPGGPDRVFDMQNIGGCWCAASFFVGADGVGRVVSSGGNSVVTWKLTVSTTAPTTPHFVREAFGQIPVSGQDPGFFTSVTSQGATAHTAVIWAIGRPVANSTSLVLYAFDATAVSGNLPLLGQYPAGTWSAPRNANIVPVVANGKVFVGSGSRGAGLLRIFGLQS